jgi:hypothetical protein
MKKHLKNILISVFAVTLVIGTSACTASAAPATDISALPEAVTSFGNGYGDVNGVTALDIPVSELTPEEVEALLFMHEEEKLARDVYNAMYELWEQPVFQNIATSEQTHMNAVKQLLDSYNLAESALAPGSFTNPNLGSLYDQLIAQGSVSLAEALKVGGVIEEIDIIDLEERIAQTDKDDIQLVFNSLLGGSYNHLNAFTRTLSMQTGETYQPQYLTPEAYAAIVTGQAGNGFGNGQQVGGPGRGGAGNEHNGPNNQ